jgi:hypothetical protein
MSSVGKILAPDKFIFKEIKSKLRLKLKKTPELLMITRVYVPYLVPAPKRLSYITKYISVRFINAAVRNITKPMWNSLLAALVQNLNKNTHEAVTFPCDLDLLLEWTPPVMESEFSVSLFNNTNEIQVPKELSQVDFEEYERGDNEEEEEEEEKGGSKNSVVVCDRHHGGGVVRSNQTFINSKPDKVELARLKKKQEEDLYNSYGTSRFQRQYLVSSSSSSSQAAVAKPLLHSLDFENPSSSSSSINTIARIISKMESNLTEILSAHDVGDDKELHSVVTNLLFNQDNEVFSQNQSQGVYDVTFHVYFLEKIIRHPSSSSLTVTAAAAAAAAATAAAGETEW